MTQKVLGTCRLKSYSIDLNHKKNGRYRECRSCITRANLLGQKCVIVNAEMDVVSS